MCFKKKNQIIKFDQNLCNVSIADNNILFLRVKSVVKSKDAVIEVPMTHNAIILKSGVFDKVIEGGHTKVFSKPSEVQDWNKGFSVEVIYFPKEVSVNMSWRTENPVSYRDPKTKKIIGVAAKGELAAILVDPTTFFKKIIGNIEVFDKDDFIERFKSIILNEFDDAFLNVIHDEKIEYSEFDRSKKSIGKKIESILNEDFTKKYGVSIEDFVIETIGRFGTEAAEAELEEEIVLDKKNDERRIAVEEREEAKAEKEFERRMREKELDSKTAVGVANAVFSGNEKEKEGDIVYCPKCGTPNSNTAKKCSKCGQELPTFGLKVDKVED